MHQDPVFHPPSAHRDVKKEKMEFTHFFQTASVQGWSRRDLTTFSDLRCWQNWWVRVAIFSFSCHIPSTTLVLGRVSELSLNKNLRFPFSSLWFSSQKFFSLFRMEKTLWTTLKRQYSLPSFLCEGWCTSLVRAIHLVSAATSWELCPVTPSHLEVEWWPHLPFPSSRECWKLM